MITQHGLYLDLEPRWTKNVSQENKKAKRTFFPKGIQVSLPKCIQYSCIKNNLNCIQNSPKCNGWILMKWKFYNLFEALLKRIRFVDVKKSFSNIRPEPLCSLEIHQFFCIFMSSVCVQSAQGNKQRKWYIQILRQYSYKICTRGLGYN